ncbi:MAG: hypothetical protein U0M47_01065 [Merdibacter sp.]|nr:hypothetical protein [Merdibacter sp.]
MAEAEDLLCLAQIDRPHAAQLLREMSSFAPVYLTKSRTPIHCALVSLRRRSS